MRAVTREIKKTCFDKFPNNYHIWGLPKKYDSYSLRWGDRVFNCYKITKRHTTLISGYEDVVKCVVINPTGLPVAEVRVDLKDTCICYYFHNCINKEDVLVMRDIRRFFPDYSPNVSIIPLKGGRKAGDLKIMNYNTDSAEILYKGKDDIIEVCKHTGVKENQYFVLKMKHNTYKATES